MSSHEVPFGSTLEFQELRMKVTSEGMPPLAGWKAHLLTALTVVSGLVGAALLLRTLDRESHPIQERAVTGAQGNR